MAQLQIASRLNWPDFILPTERLTRQMNPQFQLQMQEHEALAFLEDELDRTPQVLSASLSCDAENINSTIPTHYLSKNTGASLRLNLDDGNKYFLCCDRWQMLAHNIYALHLGLRYYRQLSEWGLGSMYLLLSGLKDRGGATATSQTADSTLTDWQKTLGIGPTATLEDANTLYRLRAKVVGEDHPDTLRTLNIAIQEARRVLG
jgi:hypothetical protein